MPGYPYCYGHREDLAEERRRNASKGGKRGGRGRGNGGELDEIKSEIKSIISGVLKGEIKTAPAAVALQGFNTMLRACEVQRRTADLSELLTRLEALEATASRIRGA